MLSNMKTAAKRILTILVIAQLAYLLIINGALRLSITQDLVNKIKPEKFQVSWERAWSFYPLRVHAEGITANGQSRTQQWEVLATSGSGSIALLPLVLKDVYISDIEATDIDYRQRPRLVIPITRSHCCDRRAICSTRQASWSWPFGPIPKP